MSPFKSLNIKQSSETVLMVKWMRGTLEFDQPYKQTETKMHETRRQAISEINLSKQKKWTWPILVPPLANSKNETAMC